MARHILSALARLLHRPTSRGQATGLNIRPAATKEEVQAIHTLITEQVPYPSFVPLPETLPDRNNHLHRELVGAWRDSHLVGAAFIGPAEQEADHPARLGLHDDAKTILDNVAMIHDLAVEPAHRRQGIALALKHWLATWARDHGTHLILSVPMNQASRDLNEAAHYIVLPPNITLVIQIKANRRTYAFPSNEGTTWALHLLTDTPNAPIRVGVHPPAPNPRPGHQHLTRVAFLN
ncbi:GNAT family N-acetyltransferase [Actinomyces israelii]|uniref:GNAT family N-acetyltransferase n=1 Tax=Actinomyces israelii TaxID=1659 RepID=UPI0005B960CA|nr:GNAT family N-acetyltransferase [Actinomyces israelii]